jgi:hypothetical protein
MNVFLMLLSGCICIVSFTCAYMSLMKWHVSTPGTERRDGWLSLAVLTLCAVHYFGVSVLHGFLAWAVSLVGW